LVLQFGFYLPALADFTEESLAGVLVKTLSGKSLGKLGEIYGKSRKLALIRANI
jgi:hypothetical protein